MQEHKVSVICVTNNSSQVENELIESLNKQDIDYELVLVDNTNQQYSSAAEALNAGVIRAQGNIIVFSHQDITFKTPYGLKELVCAIKECEIGSIVGTQGVIEEDKTIYSNLTGGKPINFDKVVHFSDKLYEVSCVDEGLFGMKRETWELHHFDEKLCDNWHLYCVEACLHARKCGHKVYVSPVHVHHSSMGRISIGYMTNLRRLCKVYRRDFKYIWTTCYKVRTNPIYINVLVFLWKYNRLLRGRSIN